MINIKNEAIDGVKWTASAGIFKSVLQVIQLIVLSRYLSSEDFGLIAIMMVVIGFAQLFMDAGISNAIIYKQDITKKQLSSLYWLNIFSSIVLTILVFKFSSVVADFYKEEKLTLLIQLTSFLFIINAVGNQFRALLKKDLNFAILAKIEIWMAILSFFLTILLAVNNFNIFSIVYAMLITTILSNIIIVKIGLKFHQPQIFFKYSEIKELVDFGLYQMGQRIIVYFNNQFDILLIGKLLGTETVGIYSVVKQLVMRPSQIINPIITNVSFPIMAKLNNNIEKIKIVYLKTVNYLSSINFIIYLLMIILSAILVPLILGENFNNSILLFQLLSIYALIRSTMNPSGSLLLARGRADIGFLWSLGEFIIIPLIIYFSSEYGIIGIAIGLIIIQIVFLIPNWYFIVNKMCNATVKEYFYTQIKPLMASIISVSFLYLIVITYTVSIVNIIVYTVITIGFYFFVSYWLNKDFVKEIKSFLIKG